MNNYKDYSEYLALCVEYNQRPSTFVQYKPKYKRQFADRVQLYNELKKSLTELDYKIIERGSVVTIYRYFSFTDEYRDFSETDGLVETINQFKLILNI